MKRVRSRAWAAVAVALGAAACVYVPVRTEVYDHECKLTMRHWTLQPVQIASIRSCRNEGCGFILAAAGATAAASAVISGSIVVVGNVVYWFEKEGRCDDQE